MQLPIDVSGRKKGPTCPPWISPLALLKGGRG